MELNQWDYVRTMPTVVDNNHESLYRSYQILQQVKIMLHRGDSIHTIREFIGWADRKI